jgi:hypothetical protein
VSGLELVKNRLRSFKKHYKRVAVELWRAKTYHQDTSKDVKIEPTVCWILAFTKANSVEHIIPCRSPLVRLMKIIKETRKDTDSSILPSAILPGMCFHVSVSTVNHWLDIKNQKTRWWVLQQLLAGFCFHQEILLTRERENCQEGCEEIHHWG